MRTTITCPNCRTPFPANVEQVIDVGQQPELKQQLLSGRLNVGQCPNCGYASQLGMPMIYHDPQHELFMVYVPMELHLPHVEQEKVIGDLVRQIMDKTPPEKRRAYMLQPKTIIKYDTLMEKVLETEGITKEMIDRQRKQAELLNTLAKADKDVADVLLQQRSREIDETFFALLQQALQQAVNAQDDRAMVKLTNLQARLYRTTAIGRELERRQMALHKFQQEVKKADGLSPVLLMKHIVANEEDERIIQAIEASAQPAFTYEFFSLLTEEIEKRKNAGNSTGASRLEKYRNQFLENYESAQKESEAVLQQASKTLQAILSAKDPQQAIRDNLEQIDEPFMYLLEMSIQQASQERNKQKVQVLSAVHQMIMQEMESQLPPEVHFINELMAADSDKQRRQILEQHPNMINQQMVAMLGMVSQQAAESGDLNVQQQMKQIQSMIQARL